jgi:hypothetical protein
MGRAIPTVESVSPVIRINARQRAALRKVFAYSTCERLSAKEHEALMAAWEKKGQELTRQEVNSIIARTRLGGVSQ